MAADLKGKGQRRNSKGIIDSPKKEKKSPSYNEATGGSTTKGKAGYKNFTEDERADWKVKHGIAPTSEDPSAIGQATKEAAKAAHARGELSDEDRRDQGIVDVREMDESKYNAAREAAARAQKDSSGIVTRNKLSPGSNTASRSLIAEGSTFRSASTASTASVASRIRSRVKKEYASSSSLGHKANVFTADLRPNTGDGT